MFSVNFPMKKQKYFRMNEFLRPLSCTPNRQNFKWILKFQSILLNLPSKICLSSAIFHSTSHVIIRPKDANYPSRRYYAVKIHSINIQPQEHIRHWKILEQNIDCSLIRNFAASAVVVYPSIYSCRKYMRESNANIPTSQSLSD